MAKPRSLYLFALVALCQYLHVAVLGQTFEFDDMLSADTHEHIKSKWFLEGTVTLDEGTSHCVKPKVDIQVVSNVCSVDLKSCPPARNQTIKSNEPCICTKQTGNDHSLRVQTRAKSSQSGLTLQAMMTSMNESNPVVTGGADIGQVPTITGSGDKDNVLQVSVAVNGEDKITPTKDTQLKVCCQQVSRVQICVQNKNPKAKLRIILNDEETSTSEGCVKVTERFDFNAPSYSLKFIHEDESQLDEFIIQIKEKKRGCKDTNAIGSGSTPSSLSVPEVKSDLPMEKVCTTLTPKGNNTKAGGGLIMVRQPNGKIVLCDTSKDGGNWTVVQRRMSENVNFYQDWKEYVEGFGTFPNEMWLGLENLHKLCSRECQLRFDLGAPKGNSTSYWAKYQYFRVLGPEQRYAIEVAGYSGNAGDSAFSSRNNLMFNTRDRNSKWAKFKKSGWWFPDNRINLNPKSNINGLFGPVDKRGVGVYWTGITDSSTSLSYTEMKVRPIVPLKEMCMNEMDKSTADRVSVSRADGVDFACETKQNGGGWTIIERRASGGVDFNRKFSEYRDGFGNVCPNETFWWGLDKITELCSKRCELRIDMISGGSKRSSFYNFFKLQKEGDKYRLIFSDGHSGNLPDGMPQIDIFYRASSKDKDYFSSMDIDYSGNKCASKRNGGWWYKGASCSKSNPNGKWGENTGPAAISWGGKVESFDLFEMKVRPLSVDGRFKPLISECYSAELKASGDIGVVQSSRKNIPLVCLSKDSKRWTLIQQRVKGDVNFTKSYVEYINGFGDIKVDGDFWIGLDNIVDMCNVYSRCQLYFNFGFENTTYSVAYKDFYLYGKKREYKIHLAEGAYQIPNGINADHLKWHAKNMNNMHFSTYNFGGSGDNAPQRRKCAREGGGGWWYIPGWEKNPIGCREINPNGVFKSTGKTAVSFMTVTSPTSSASFIKLWVTNSNYQHVY